MPISSKISLFWEATQFVVSAFCVQLCIHDNRHSYFVALDRYPVNSVQNTIFTLWLEIKECPHLNFFHSFMRPAFHSVVHELEMSAVHSYLLFLLLEELTQ